MARRPLVVTATRLAGAGLALSMVALTVAARAYYFAEPAIRVRHPWHRWLKPSGLVGQPLGLLALAMFLFLWLYPLRKKLGPRFRWAGSVSTWLNIHIVAGLLVPLAAAVHASWRFTGLIGLGYASMFVVFLSGLIGRYLYAQIPRSRAGLELSREEMAGERRALLLQIARATGLEVPEVERQLVAGSSPQASASIPRLLIEMVRADWSRRRAARRLARRWVKRDDPQLGKASQTRTVARLLRREMALAQQARILDGVQRVFRYWHAAHKPFAVTALLAVLLHVAVAAAMGVTWLW